MRVVCPPGHVPLLRGIVEGMSSALRDFPFEMVRLACEKCPRKGHYRKSMLIERDGADANMIELRKIITADCPKIVANKIPDLCGVIYPGLRPTPLEPRKRA